MANRKMVVFGGHYGNGEEFVYLNDTWIIDLDTLTWHEARCGGEVPPPRYGHTAEVIGSRMFIFGGRGPRGKVYRDIYFLDLVDWVWVPVHPVTEAPPPRFLHSSVLVGRKLVILGGWDGEFGCYSDLWLFDTDTFSWMQPRTAGFAPTARYGHTMTLLPDGRLVLMGGAFISEETPCPKYLSDVKILDTDTMVWSRPKIEGDGPSGRYGHTATALPGGRCVALFGGWGAGGVQNVEILKRGDAKPLWILDCAAMRWVCPSKLNRKPVHVLYNHCAALEPESGAMCVFGGFDGRSSIKDMYVLEWQLDAADGAAADGSASAGAGGGH